MGASAVSGTSGRPNTVKVTILKSPSPLPISPSPKPPSVFRLSPPVRLSIAEDVKGESEQTDHSTCDNLRSHVRRKKIAWQHTTPDSCLKVNYVNIASAASISPGSCDRTKAATMTPSPCTTPSPVELTPGSFSEASKRRNSLKSMHDFATSLENEKLPLTCQHKSPGTKTPLQHTKIRYRLNVPRQTVPIGTLTSEQSESNQFLFKVKTRRKDAVEGVKTSRGQVYPQA